MLHLPSIPEAESEDVTQSYDVKPQSIYAENLLSVSPDQEQARAHRLSTYASGSVT